MTSHLACFAHLVISAPVTPCEQSFFAQVMLIYMLALSLPLTVLLAVFRDLPPIKAGQKPNCGCVLALMLVLLVCPSPSSLPQGLALRLISRDINYLGGNFVASNLRMSCIINTQNLVGVSLCLYQLFELLNPLEHQLSCL